MKIIIPKEKETETEKILLEKRKKVSFRIKSYKKAHGSETIKNLRILRERCDERHKDLEQIWSLKASQRINVLNESNFDNVAKRGFKSFIIMMCIVMRLEHVTEYMKIAEAHMYEYELTEKEIEEWRKCARKCGVIFILNNMKIRNGFSKEFIRKCENMAIELKNVDIKLICSVGNLWSKNKNRNELLDPKKNEMIEKKIMECDIKTLEDLGRKTWKKEWANYKSICQKNQAIHEKLCLIEEINPLRMKITQWHFLQTLFEILEHESEKHLWKRQDYEPIFIDGIKAQITTSSCFWQIEIADMKERWPCLTPALKETWSRALRQPRTFHRQNPTPETRELQIYLQHLAWIWRSNRPPSETEHIIQIIQTGDWDDILFHFSSFLESCVLGDDIKKDNRLEELGKKRIKEFYLPKIHEIIDACQMTDVKIRKEEELLWEKEIKNFEDEIETENQRTKEENDLLLKTHERIKKEVKTEEIKEEITTSFQYVTTLGSIHSRKVRFLATEENLAEKLKPIFDDQKSKIPIPIESIARAIYHYINDVPEEMKNVWPKDEILEKYWAKVKRDDARIFLRKEDGTWNIHAINRKDWITESALAAKF